MSLAEYRILSAENREVQDTNGGDEWIVVYEIPAEKLTAERPNFRRSVDNVLPESEASDPFPPHIHYSSISPVDSETYAVKCIYRRPTPGSLLRPGRGIVRVQSYTTTRMKTVETTSDIDIPKDVLDDADLTYTDVTTAYGGSFRDLVIVFGGNLANPNQYETEREYQQARDKYDKLQETIIREEAEKRTRDYFPTVQVPEVSERLRLVVQTCDWWSEFFPAITRADAWVGTAGELTIKDFSTVNAKCSGITISLRSQDTSLVDCEYTFDIRQDTWPVEGDVPVVTWKVTRRGTSIIVRQAPLNIDTDVATKLGSDFTALDDYFDWWPTAKQANFRSAHSTEIVDFT